MNSAFLASRRVYAATLALFIGSSVLSLAGNIFQNTSLFQRLPASWQSFVQGTGDLAWATVAMMAARRFVPDRIPQKMEIAAVLLSIYFALGESFLPLLLPGVPDPRDIPAALIGVAIYYVYDRSRTAYRRAAKPTLCTV
jgi:zinc transporter ZupT